MIMDEVSEIVSKPQMLSFTAVDLVVVSFHGDRTGTKTPAMHFEPILHAGVPFYRIVCENNCSLPPVSLFITE